MAQSATRVSSRLIPLNSTRGGHENWRPSANGNFRKHSHTAWTISVHPYITGVPHRLRYFADLLAYIQDRGGACFMTGAEIADWYREQVPDKNK